MKDKVEEEGEGDNENKDDDESENGDENGDSESSMMVPATAVKMGRKIFKSTYVVQCPSISPFLP